MMQDASAVSVVARKPSEAGLVLSPMSLCSGTTPTVSSLEEEEEEAEEDEDDEEEEGREQRGRRRWAAVSAAAAPPPPVAPAPPSALSGKAQRGCLHGVQRCSSAHLRLHTISARPGAGTATEAATVAAGRNKEGGPRSLAGTEAVNRASSACGDNRKWAQASGEPSEEA